MDVFQLEIKKLAFRFFLFQINTQLKKTSH